MADVALEFLDFEFSYPACGDGEIPCGVGPVSWACPQGAFVLLTGDTGSGKTTLLRCVKPELAPQGSRAGYVKVLGRDSLDFDGETSASCVGYVAQSADNQLICDSVWHQMAFGLESLGVDQDLMRRRVAEVAHFFGIEPWFDADVNSLSGGQKQLLNLASVLVMRPRLLLLDEPTAQLDPVAEKNFSHALFRLNRELGLTVVVATHAPEQMADYATEAVRLKGGRLYEESLEQLRGRRLEIPKPARGVAQGAAAVTLDDVHVRYGKQFPWVLRGLGLSVRTGLIHALVGGNASGKTTVLSTVAGALKIERGTCANTLSHAQALLPQNPKSLFVCDTVLDELREWQPKCGYSDGEIRAALSHIGLAQAQQRHPYDLSGGQQQLLALAKLLLAQPELLLLDEPTKGLDAACKIEVAHLLLKVKDAGATILMATHDLSFAAAVADEVSMLFDGDVACTQPTADFFEENLFYRPVADAFWRAWASDNAEGARL